MRIVGLDPGVRRIGVALSDAEEMLASPLTVIERKTDEEALDAIVAVLKEYNVGLIIVGMPRHLDGRMGIQATKVQGFIDELSKKTAIPIETRDEWLSTVAANRLLREAGSKTKNRHVDAMAAAFVLQGYLDGRRGNTQSDIDGNLLMT